MEPGAAPLSQAYEVIGEQLRGQAAEVLAAWLPKGRRQGREWCVGSLEGQPGQSLKINIDTGKWQDWATGEKGGDLVSLYAAIHGIPQHEALARLGGDDLLQGKSNGSGRTPGPDDEGPHFVPPPPDVDVRPARFAHPNHGEPTHTYLYRAADGSVLYAVARYELPDGKQFCPWTWDGTRWRAKGPPKPRPLYGLDVLARLNRRVVVVEGEKARDALQSLVKRSPVVTWSGGANNWRYADWEPLRGREVLLWPDADPPGVAAMQGAAALLLKLDCKVERIDTEGLPDAFDAADLVDELRGSGGDLNQWLKPRMFPVEHIVPSPKEPRRIREPVVESRNIEAPEYAGDGGYELQRFGVQVTRAGVLNSQGNAGLVIQGLMDSGLLPRMWYDEFLQRRMGERGEWTDEDDLALVHRLHTQYKLHKLSYDNICRGAHYIASLDRRNCALDWLSRLRWDGESRLNALCPTGFGAADNDYVQAVGRCFVMGIVARVLHPGCQLDNLPIFEGPQGARKSSSLRILGGEWHAEVTEDVRNKDFFLSLRGKMLVEISELSSFRKGDLTLVKAIIARPTDPYRKPFARHVQDHPRQCAFAATTNNYRWNLDPSGARRYWPIRCGLIDVEWIRAHRELLFAEAYERVKDGEPWWDVPEELAYIEQRSRYNLDALESPMRLYLEGKRFATLDQILVQGLGLEKAQRFDQMITSRVLGLLQRWGWREGAYTDPDSGQSWNGFNAP